MSPRAEIRIDRVGAEGDGIGTGPDERPVFVPFVLPGETVRVRLGSGRGDGVAGTVEEVLTPSAERAVPVCAHFGTCGGCALQHWRMDGYLAWKAGLLTAALRRAGYDTVPATIVPIPQAARRRVDLAVRRTGLVTLGLHKARGAEVVDIAGCTVLHPDLERLLVPLRVMLQGLGALRREGSAILNLLDSGADLLLRTDGPLAATDRAKLAAFAAEYGLPRVSWALRAGPAELAAGIRPAVTAMAGVAVVPPAGGFLQASREGEAAIVAAVLAGLPAKLTAKSRVAELYAGCGTITFPLSARVRVDAFEGDAAAFASLKAAVDAALLSGRVVPARRDLARQPLLAKELAAFAAVVLDPPHAGAGPQMALIAASGVRRVIYVSCNPQALARDAAVLRAAGYQLISAVPIDQFLWSPRLESVVVFARG